MSLKVGRWPLPAMTSESDTSTAAIAFSIAPLSSCPTHATFGETIPMPMLLLPAAPGPTAAAAAAVAAATALLVEPPGARRFAASRESS